MMDADEDIDLTIRDGLPADFDVPDDSWAEGADGDGDAAEFEYLTRGTGGGSGAGSSGGSGGSGGGSSSAGAADGTDSA